MSSVKTAHCVSSKTSKINGRDENEHVIHIILHCYQSAGKLPAREGAAPRGFSLRAHAHAESKVCPRNQNAFLTPMAGAYSIEPTGKILLSHCSYILSTGSRAQVCMDLHPYASCRGHQERVIPALNRFCSPHFSSGSGLAEVAATCPACL